MKRAFLAVVLVLASLASAHAAQVVRLGVTGSIYDEIWAPAKEALAEQGIELELVQFTDYVTPNRALADGDIDLNGFQHQVYLKDEIESRGYELTNIANTFVVPLNLYSIKIKSVSEIKDGDIIAIPNDPTNGGRALKVLSGAGLITLKGSAGFDPTKDDIEKYDVAIEIEELAANAIPAALPDVTAAIINDSYALDYGLKASEAVFQDTSIKEEEYWNLIAARTKDLDDPDKVALYDAVVKAFQSQGTRDVLAELHGGFFLDVGWDVDRLAPFKK
ncbi:MAG: MetQ/NlpA family ABC transporter substrate-binding protein [Synergistaceae bacterium]|nr:MetQ/NlpA family ABC transporter substrate-binding protein [Synergistaceae bacterium]